MLIHLNETNINVKSIDQIVKCLKDGGIIIYPTDTVYALGCDITNSKAVERICKLKGIQPEKSNFSFVCNNLSHLSEFTKAIPNHVFRIMKKALPGPYTFILEANNNVPKLLKQNRKTVGIRVPDNILEYFSDPEIIHQQYGEVVDMVIDGGYGNIHASTVIDFSGDEPVIIREGLGSLDVFY
jgi:tRNA A37 threonylcarbamoyladenosine synthetase subunit TsaC/SUA5/YrdC